MNRNTLWLGATAVCWIYCCPATAQAADPQKIVLQSKEVKLVDGRLEIPPASACILVLPAN